MSGRGLCLAGAFAGATVAFGTLSGCAQASAIEVARSQSQGETIARLADGFTGIWYEIKEPDGQVKYGGGLATYPQQVNPSAIYLASQNKTFFTVMLDEGSGRVSHALSWYDHDTGLVARPRVWVDTDSGDAHDAPALTIDEMGYIYLFSSTHGEARRSFLRRSVRPWDIDSFTDELDPSDQRDMEVFGPTTPDGEQTIRFSYGSPWRLGTGAEAKTILIYTRYMPGREGLPGERDLFVTSTVDGRTFSEPQPMVSVEAGQYGVDWIKPDGSAIGLAFDRHPSDAEGPPSDSRTDLYFIQTSDGITWRNAAGEILVQPGQYIQSANNPAMVYDAPGTERVYMKDVSWLSDGSPVILFLTSPTHRTNPLPPGQARQLKLARWTGRDWRITDVVDTDHAYDHGSLYVEQAEDGTDVLSIVGPFLTGPQAFATGGRIGRWESRDLGATWRQTLTLPHVGERNDTYVRRPLRAQPDFWSLWADGNGLTPSPVAFYFASRDGRRFQLPLRFEAGQDSAAPLQQN